MNLREVQLTNMAVKTTDQEVSIPDDILKKIKPAKLEEVPLVLNKRNFHWVTEKICGIVEQKNTNLVVVVFYCCDVYSQFHWSWTCLFGINWSWCLG